MHNITSDLLPLATPVADLHLDPTNVRIGHDVDGIAASLVEYGQMTPIVVHHETSRILKGNGTFRAAKALGWDEIAAVRAYHDATKATGYAIADNRLGDSSKFDDEALGRILATLPDDLPTGVPEDELAQLLASVAPPAEGDGDAVPQVDRAEELRAAWGVELGQLWQLGEHRLICDDSTDVATVERLMQDRRAVLVHADPPYGMGKESEGIANDNLRGARLDAFQMSWWSAIRPFCADNASAYIWGNAPELWRLWYVGGLASSERLSLRNEIVWAKGSAGAGGISHMGADYMRMYPAETERCLFFMLGEQEMSNNADSFWEGFEPIRAYLASEAERVGLTPAMVKEITGVGMYSHWFSRSQWTLIPEKHFNALRDAIDGLFDGPDRADLYTQYEHLLGDYAVVRDAFYATRARFDNSHALMTDVWDFARVTGEDRFGHATPKPVELSDRVMRSSSDVGDVVVVPFLGSGPELISAQNLSRKCYAIEISPAYVAVALQRFSDAFGITPERIE